MRAAPPSRVRSRARSCPPLPPAPACDARCVSPGAWAISRAGVSSTFRAIHSSGTVSRIHFFSLWYWVPLSGLSLEGPFLLPYRSGRVQLLLTDPQGNSGPKAMPGEDLARSGGVHPSSRLPSFRDPRSVLGTFPAGVRPRVSPRSSWATSSQLAVPQTHPPLSSTLRYWSQGGGLGDAEM